MKKIRKRLTLDVFLLLSLYESSFNHSESFSFTGIKEFGEKYGCLNLVTKAMTLIKQRFQGVAQAEEFMSLSLDGLIELLKCSDLNLGRVLLLATFR